MKSQGVDPADYVDADDPVRLLGDAFTIELHAVEPRSTRRPIARTSPPSSCAPDDAEARPGLVFGHGGARLNGSLYTDSALKPVASATDQRLIRALMPPQSRR